MTTITPSARIKIPPHGKRHHLSPLIIRLYGFDRRRLCQFLRFLACRLEGGPSTSLTLRSLFLRYHSVEVGLFSCGGFFAEHAVGAMTTVGRHCWMAPSARTFNANHPQNLISSHAIFYNPVLGLTDSDLLSRTRLTIMDGVRIGHNAVVLSSVSSIGTCAMISPNTVVHQNVPEFAIVEGNPGRVIGFHQGTAELERMMESR